MPSIEIPSRLELADFVADALLTSHAPHYRASIAARTRERCRRLVEAFAASLAGQPSALAIHVQAIAAERWAEGYALEELQLALTLLESHVWRLVVERSAARDVVRHLGIVTTTIGSAKDALARAYVERASSGRTFSAAADELLFAGTEGHVEPDTESASVR